MKNWGYFASAIEELRSWIEEGSRISKEEWLFFQKNLFKKKQVPHEDIRRFKEYLRKHWPEILDYFKDIFNAWSAAGTLGPFGQGEAKAVWTNFVFEETLRLFSNFY
jgi:hypothetical protein